MIISECEVERKLSLARPIDGSEAMVAAMRDIDELRDFVQAPKDMLWIPIIGGSALNSFSEEDCNALLTAATDHVEPFILDVPVRKISGPGDRGIFFRLMMDDTATGVLHDAATLRKYIRESEDLSERFSSLKSETPSARLARIVDRPHAAGRIPEKEVRGYKKVLRETMPKTVHLGPIRPVVLTTPHLDRKFAETSAHVS